MAGKKLGYREVARLFGMHVTGRGGAVLQHAKQAIPPQLTRANTDDVWDAFDYWWKEDYKPRPPRRG